MEWNLDTKGVTIAFTHPTPRDVAWRCDGYANPQVFDPQDELELAEAQAVCAGCAVRTLCLALGTSRDEWGVWGGVLLENGKPTTRKFPPRLRALVAITSHTGKEGGVRS